MILPEIPCYFNLKVGASNPAACLAQPQFMAGPGQLTCVAAARSTGGGLPAVDGVF